MEKKTRDRKERQRIMTEEKRVFAYTFESIASLEILIAKAKLNGSPIVGLNIEVILDEEHAIGNQYQCDVVLPDWVAYNEKRGWHERPVQTALRELAISSEGDE
tara:strand:+ start:5240 stop:5551 length:312 start_codon:yes stop_codon:yes gene_type:complete